MAARVNANVAKTMQAMQRQYGAVAGKKAFFATINSNRRHKPGDAFLHALGADTDKGAASGGKGALHAKASPWRADNTPKRVATRHPVQFKRP